MYVVKKCANYTHGKNAWVDVHVTPDKEDAISYIREEYRLLLSSNPNLSSADIDRNLNAYYDCPKPGDTLYSRRVVRHGNVAFSIQSSHASKYDQWNGLQRPDRNELLDKILG